MDVKTKKWAFLPILMQKNRDISCEYSFVDSNGVAQTVSRKFFITCLQVTPSRIYSALKTINTNPACKEQRGTHPSVKKTPTDDFEAVKRYIESIPAYESHYGRSNSQKKYLSSNLNIITLYRKYEYVERMQFQQRKYVSEHMFRQIFNTEFNLAFKRRHTDTCKLCDEYANYLNSPILTQSAKDAIISKRDAHLDLVNYTIRILKDDVEKAKNSEGETTVLTFDLQKTLPTISLATSIAYYKRQLWTFNLCVYDEVHQKG